MVPLPRELFLNGSLGSEVEDEEPSLNVNEIERLVKNNPGHVTRAIVEVIHTLNDCCKVFELG